MNSLFWNSLIQQKINQFTVHLFQKWTNIFSLIIQQHQSIKIKKIKQLKHSFSLNLRSISELSKKKYSKDSHIIKKNFNFKSKLNKSQPRSRNSNFQSAIFNQRLILTELRNNCIKKSKNKENSLLMFFKGLKLTNFWKIKEKLSKIFKGLMELIFKIKQLTARKIKNKTVKVEVL